MKNIGVKICGNKSIYDVQSCVKVNANIIGVLVEEEHSSNDFINKDIVK